MSEPLPSLSIVVAVQGGAQRLGELLRALDPQRGRDTEIIVAYAGEHDDVPARVAAFPWVRLLPGARGALAPHLWRDGILTARGRKVALTIVHCRPGPGWVEGLRRADLTTYAAVGGALENEIAADGLSWAVYFQRYLPYAPPFAARETTDLAGDNAVYDRAALLEHEEAWAQGFWEPEIHARLGRQGRKLLLDPALVTVHANGYDARAFATMRFDHGVQFGRDRAHGMGTGRWCVQVALAPAVPVIFGAKIARRLWARPALRRHAIAAAPYLTAFLCAWAAGELVGTLQGRAGAGRT